LNHVKIESFFVKKTKRLINYKLDLFKNVKVFLVFYILLLKLVDPSTSIQKTFHYKSQKENQFKVKRILEQENQQYLIK